MAQWDAIDDPGDIAQITAYADRMAGLSGAAQRAMANTLAGYLQAASGDRDEEWDAEEVTGEAVRGDDGGMSHAWAIPAYSMWKKMGEGMERAQAFTEAREQVGVQAQTDLALAQREAMRDLGGALDSVIGYRRVVGDSACEFCTLISTRLYFVEDLMPVHPNCQCSVAPVIRHSDGTIDDPGAVLDGEPPVGSEAEFEAEVEAGGEPAPPPAEVPYAERVPIEGFRVRDAANVAELEELYGPGAADNLMGTVTERQVEVMRETVAKSFEGIRPEVQENLGAIRAADPNGDRRKGDDHSGDALAWFLPEGGRWDRQYDNEIHVGQSMTGQRWIDDQLAKAGNWWVPVDTTNGLENTLTHEIGHFLDHQMTDDQRQAMRTAAWKEAQAMLHPAQATPARGYPTGEMEAPRVREGERNRKGEVNPEDTGRFLSVYATTNSNELIAEGWAEYKLSDHPGRVATAIGEHIMAALGPGGSQEEEDEYE